MRVASSQRLQLNPLQCNLIKTLVWERGGLVFASWHISRSSLEHGSVPKTTVEPFENLYCLKNSHSLWLFLTHECYSHQKCEKHVVKLAKSCFSRYSLDFLPAAKWRRICHINITVKDLKFLNCFFFMLQTSCSLRYYRQDTGSGIDSQDIKSRLVFVHFNCAKTWAKPVCEDVIVAGGPVLVFSKADFCPNLEHHICEWSKTYFKEKQFPSFHTSWLHWMEKTAGVANCSLGKIFAVEWQNLTAWIFKSVNVYIGKPRRSSYFSKINFWRLFNGNYFQ